ncbi:rod shape-determining protein MreC [Zoogloea sp.]|uniref:rod shape-determining protein MreC n=1 Tax=Zoogloea sp. TaxID=49181 RepID=UPI00258F8AE1|nr:rod shape-determining protein MreC [Zoogloea sp.]MDD2669069.1 rod shape-determining protein MreC [Zoogloea sp.]
MAGHSPPPFFKRGPAPLAKLVFFVTVSLAMLVSDLNMRYLDGFRQGLSVLAYPLQMAAASPADFVRNASDYFASLVRLQIENKDLKARQLKGAERLLRLDQLEQENRHLRALLEAREKQSVKSVVAEIMYTAKDPFSRKVILDKGAQAGIEAGQAVVDDIGVIGQITRVFPMQSELTLLTDKDQAIPVMIVRSGMRAVLFGSGNGLMELRYLAANADVQAGDRVVTSGLDGVFLAGLPVATVARVERDQAQAFARIPCLPAAGVERFSHVLVLGHRETLMPRPVEPEPVAGKPAKGRKARAAKE